MAMLRKLGDLATLFLKDQMNREQSEYESGLVRQRQQEGSRQNVLQGVAQKIGEQAVKSRLKPSDEQLAAVDAADPEVGRLIRAQAGMIPSDEQVSAGALSDVNKDINAAKTPEELGSLGNRFEQFRTSTLAQNAPIRDLSQVTALGKSFNDKADVIGNAAATKQEQGVADAKSNYDITHPDESETVVYIPKGADGKPSGPPMVMDATVPSGYRPVTAADKFVKGRVKYIEGSPEFNNGVPYSRPVDQTALEQQGRNVVMRTLSSRTGNFGIEDQKVNTAVHLRQLLDASKDPKTGTYDMKNVPLKELAMGTARLLSPTGQVGIELMQEFVAPTLQGDFSKAMTYASGGFPVNATSQDIVNMYKDLIDRQAEVAESNRENALDVMRDSLPTELDEAHKAGLLSALSRLTYYSAPRTGLGQDQVGGRSGVTAIPGANGKPGQVPGESVDDVKKRLGLDY